MESTKSQERDDGLRLRRNVQEEEEQEVESSEEDVKTDLVKRIIESTKELTDCMPTDLPSAKRMVSTLANSCVETKLCATSFFSLQLEDGFHAAAEFSSDMAAGAGAVAEQAGDICRKVIEASWKVCHFQALPHWLQDNDYLIWGHRPPLPSFTACFQSLFRIHTETGNIWTHLIGCVAFVSLAVYTLIWSELQTEERLVFAAFFAGAILCLGLSCTYHTVHCHSEFVGKLFSKLDYVGISFLILGSLVPWLYYTFYCQYQPKVIYLTVATVLGLGAITTSLLDQFGEPKYRPFRAGTAHFSHVLFV